MIFVDNVSKEEYESFVNSYDSHFMKSYYWADVKRINYKPHYVGILVDNELVAAALLLEKHIIGHYCFFYCPSGFTCDYTDKELLKFFASSLKKYCKKRNGLFLRINPDIELQELDNDGNIIEGINNHSIVDNLVSLGFKHKGFNKNFETEEPRYTFGLDVFGDIKNIRKGFHSTTRNIINRGNIYNLKISKGNIDDINLFYEAMKETSEREQFTSHSLDYYKHFFSVLNRHNMSDVYTVSVNLSDLKILYTNKIEQLEEQLKGVDDKNEKKAASKRLEFVGQIDKLKKELEEIITLDDKELVLSSMITVKYQDTVWTVHGGNKNVLRFLNANYWLYYTIIEDANKDGFKVVDFFGTTGNPDPSNHLYGIHLFKKRFGGKYIEFIGEFDFVTNKTMYFLYSTLIPLYRKFRRKR